MRRTLALAALMLTACEVGGGVSTESSIIANKGEDLAAFLTACAARDPDAAASVACALLEQTEGKPPFALLEGEPARAAAETACPSGAGDGAANATNAAAPSPS